MKLYFNDVLPYLGDMFSGLGYSIFLTVVSMAFGLLVGIVAYLGKSSKNKILSGISRIYIELIRNTPMLVQLYILYFGNSYMVFLSYSYFNFISLKSIAIINTQGKNIKVIRVENINP